MPWQSRLLEVWLRPKPCCGPMSDVDSGSIVLFLALKCGHRRGVVVVGTQRLPAQKTKKLSQKCKVTLQRRSQYRTWRRRPFKGDNAIALLEGPVEKCDSIDNFEGSLSPSVILWSILKGHFALLREVLLHLREAGTVGRCDRRRLGG